MPLKNKTVIFQERLANHHMLTTFRSFSHFTMLSLESFALTDPGKPGCVASPNCLPYVQLGVSCVYFWVHWYYHNPHLVSLGIMKLNNFRLSTLTSLWTCLMENINKRNETPVIKCFTERSLGCGLSHFLLVIMTSAENLSTSWVQSFQPFPSEWEHYSH